MKPFILDRLISVTFIPCTALPSLIALSLLICGSTLGQNIDYRFSLYRTNTKFADALQSKLLAGGDDAKQAMSKMPSFTSNGQATLLSDLQNPTPTGKCSRISSELATHKNRDGKESMLGLNIELEPSIHYTGIVNCRIVVDYRFEHDKSVKSYFLNTFYDAKHDMPILLARWQEGDINYMFIASANWDKGEPREAREIVHPMPYIDLAIYQSAGDANAYRNPVFRSVYPAKSGSHAISSVKSTVDYKIEGDWSLQQVSCSYNTQVLLAEDNSKLLIPLRVRHEEPTGKTVRSPNGGRRPQIIIRSANGNNQFKIGEIKNTDMTDESDEKSNSSAWKLSTKALLYDLK